MWHEPSPIETPESLRSAVGGHPLVAEMLARRGLTDPATALAFLDPTRYTPTLPSALPDLESAAEKLTFAIRNTQHILVWGDFDVDGQTSTALLYSMLRDLAADVSYYIPHRLTESHGIKVKSLERLIDERNPDVLLTCDTGIAEHSAITYAKSRGLTVLVTDHHDLPDTLPDADALVNPKRLPAGHPLRELPGVGVTFKLAQQVYATSGQETSEMSNSLQDLVALGIVADVALQVNDTRYLLQRGLDQLRRTSRLGLQVLMESAKIDATHLSAEHIGFGIGPRLNALGRLGDAALAVELLTTEDLSRARIIAAQIEGLNNQRRMLAEQIYAAAQEQIAKDASLLDKSVLVLASPHWHAGVIGPVASRLTEMYERPTVMLVVGEDGRARGSARSVPGVDISAALSLIRERLLSYGGHPGAAGMSLKAEDVSIFRSALSRAVESIRDHEVTPRGTQIDVFVPLSEVTLELAQQIERLAPFGAGNRAVTLAAKDVSIIAARNFGRRGGEHREVTIEDGQGAERQLVWWRGADEELPGGRLDVAMTIRSTDYRGRQRLAIEWVDARVIDAALEISEPEIDVIDWRKEPDVAQRVRELIETAKDDVIVWSDGVLPDTNVVAARRRYDLEPAKTLVIWRAPVGHRELAAALVSVEPQAVYVCDVDSNAAVIRFDVFIKRLAGLMRHDLERHEGRVHVPRLAAAAGQRLSTARKGIEWLAVKGRITIVDIDGDEIRIAPSGEGREDEMQVDLPPHIIDASDAEEIRLQIDGMLSETRAYQTHFRRADVKSLIAVA